MTRLLVCGGRAYADLTAVFAALDRVHRERYVTLVIEGGAGRGEGNTARGADRLARAWGRSRGVPVQTMRAEWGFHGKGAGPKRNERMLVEGRPDYAVCFPGGGGTLDMIERLLRAAVPFEDLDPRPLAQRRALFHRR